MPRKIATEEDSERALAYGRVWYRKNAEQVKARKEIRQREIRQWFEEHKLTLACQGCGENHPATLDFHHRNPSEKEVSITDAVHNGWSIEHLQREIKKCDVLCANCHRRLHRALD